jgi:hypothetical protein
MSAPTATHSDTLRRADVATLAAALNDQKSRSVDVVVPAGQIRTVLGAVDLSTLEPVVSEDGVTNVAGHYIPTGVAEEGISDKLGIPLPYLRRMRTDAPDLLDSNINRWCADAKPGTSYLLRLLTHHDGARPDGSAGVLRAFLSNSFRTIDNFDVLLAVLDGIRAAGVANPVIDADLTERRMVVRVSTPDVAVLAPKLLEGYRSPFGGHDVGGGWTPQRVAAASRSEGQAIEGGGQTVFAGFVVSNGDVGGTAFSIVPRLVVKVCNNGLTIAAEALRKVHVGAKLDDGMVKVSDRTVKRTLALITSQATDAVETFLDADYLAEQVAKLEEVAGEPVNDASAVLTAVSRKFGFTEAEQSAIMNHFIRGGQPTAGGVMQAMTSVAQTVKDGEAAYALEQKAVPAMHEAATVSRALARV